MEALYLSVDDDDGDGGGGGDGDRPDANSSLLALNQSCHSD